MGQPRLTLAATVAALLLTAPASAGHEPPPAGAVRYRPPVPGPVVDPFRPPGSPYGPGNRGLDYATTPGEPVVAPAEGIVTFAGAVAGGLHVVVLHADGIRTSLSFLAAILVVRGQQVTGGQAVGLAGATVHLGARRGAAYLDPATLFRAEAGTRSILVPDGPDRPAGADEEADALRRLLAATSRPAPAPLAGRPATPGAVAPPAIPLIRP